MTTVFITGDRSVPADVAVGLVAATMLKQVVEAGGIASVDFATGTENGVEAAVRFVSEFTGLNVQAFETPAVEGHEAEGWKDFGQRTQNVLAAETDTKFLVLHNDAQASRITRAILDVAPDDQVEIISPSLV